MNINKFPDKIKNAMRQHTLGDLIPSLDSALMLEVGHAEPKVCMEMIKVLSGVTDDYETRILSYGVMTHPIFADTPFFCQNIDTLSDLEEEFCEDNRISQTNKGYIILAIQRGQEMIRQEQIRVNLYNYLKDKLTTRPEDICLKDFTYIWNYIQTACREQIAEIEMDQPYEEGFSTASLNVIYYSTWFSRILLGLLTNETQEAFIGAEKNRLENRSEFFSYLSEYFSDSVESLMDGDEPDFSVNVGDFTLTVNWNDLTPALSVKPN